MNNRLKEVGQTQFLLNHLPQLRDKCSQQDLNPTKTEWGGLKNPPRTVPAQIMTQQLQMEMIQTIQVI